MCFPNSIYIKCLLPWEWMLENEYELNQYWGFGHLWMLTKENAEIANFKNKVHYVKVTQMSYNFSISLLIFEYRRYYNVEASSPVFDGHPMIVLITAIFHS